MGRTLPLCPVEASFGHRGLGNPCGEWGLRPELALPRLSWPTMASEHGNCLTFHRVVNNLPVKFTFRSIRNVRTCVLNTRTKFRPGFIDSFFFLDLSGAHPLLLRNYLWPCMARARSISAPTGHGWCRVVVQLLRDRMSPRCNASASLRAVRAPRRVL